MEATIVNLGKEIQHMERQAEIEADMVKATTSPILTTPAAQNTEPEKTGTASVAYSDAFWNSIRNRNWIDVRNDLHVGTDTEGGYLVPDPEQAEIVKRILLIGKQTAVAANVGDSRIYQFRDGKIIYQSVDHSVGQMAVLVGEIQPDQIRQYPKRSQLACNLRPADKKAVSRFVC